MFTTYYKNKSGARRHYTTKTHTKHHGFLRERFGGETWCHSDAAALDFIPGLPLFRPHDANARRVL